MTNFRNNMSKCSFNNIGYCKFKEKYRNQHTLSICQHSDCDQSCPDRCPKPCRFKAKCKFIEKYICAFSHATFVQND